MLQMLIEIPLGICYKYLLKIPSCLYFAKKLVRAMGIFMTSIVFFHHTQRVQLSSHHPVKFRPLNTTASA